MNMCPSNKRKLPPELCLKGQVFFICSNYQSVEIVKDKISLLGGKVDVFLTKNVTTVLVEDTHLCGPQLIPNDLTLNAAYAPNAVILSNFQYQSGFSNLPSTSRGFNLLASSPANSPYRIIGYARQCGIQVLGIYHFLTLIDQQVKSAIYLKKKTLENVSNLSGCFIKFESCFKKYRPCYKMFNNDPERLMPLKNAKLLVKPDTCNVILEKPIPTKQHFNHMDTNDRKTHRVNNDCNVNATVKGADRKAQTINKVKPKEENNYCECCKVHFSDLKQHIKSSKHQNFVSNEKNYESVHSILKMLPSAQEFIEKHQTPEINAAAVFSNSEGFIQDNSPEIASAIDYSIPLDLHRKKTADDAALPLNLHVTKQDVLIPMNLHAKQIEEASMPLNLHIKKECDLEENELVKIENEPFIPEADELNPFYHNEANVAQEKAHPLNDDLLVTVKLNNKDEAISSEMPNAETTNLDPLFDKTNTAALAQLCLKNFDSYWLDNIPCEMDDLIFDDNIFDIDDGKLKAGNEQTDGLVSMAQDSPITTDIQTPAMVSGISTVCLKTQSSTSTSLFFNCSTSNEEISIKNEPDTLCESFQSSCKPENSTKPVSPQNTSVSYNELPIDKKKIKVEKEEDVDFKSSISTFYSEKPHTDAIPSCSAVKPHKMAEQMFSSDSSDDENGSVLISNVLNIITYSDNDAKDKDSCNEDSDGSKKSIEVDVKNEVSPKTCATETSIRVSKPKTSPTDDQLSESNTHSPYNELPEPKGHVSYDLISKSKGHQSHKAASGTHNRISHDLTLDSKVDTPYSRFSEAKVNVSVDQFAESKIYAPYKQLSQSKTHASFDPMSKSKEHAPYGQLIESKTHASTSKPSKPKFQFTCNQESKVDSVYQFSETEIYASDDQVPKSKGKIISNRLKESEKNTFCDQVSESRIDASYSAQSKSKSPSFIQLSESKDQACYKDLSKSKIQSTFSQSAESNVYEPYVPPSKIKVEIPYDQPSEYRSHAPYNQMSEAKFQLAYNEPSDSKVHFSYDQPSKSRTKSYHDHFPELNASASYVQPADSKLLAPCDQLQKPKAQVSSEHPVELRVYPPSDKVKLKLHAPYDQVSKKDAPSVYSQETESKAHEMNDRLSFSKTSQNQSCNSKDSVLYDQSTKLESRAAYNQQVESKVSASFDHLSSSKAKLSHDQLSEYKNQPSFHIVPAAKIERMHDEPASSKSHASYNQAAESKIHPNFVSAVNMKMHAPYDKLPKAKAKSLYNQLSDSKGSAAYDRQSKSIVQAIYDEPLDSRSHVPYQTSKLKAGSSHHKFSKGVTEESYRVPNSKVCASYDMINESKILTPQEQQFKLRPKSSYEKFSISNAHPSYEMHHSKLHASYDQPFESKLHSSLDQLSKSKLHPSFDQSLSSKDQVTFDQELKTHPSYAIAQVANLSNYKVKSINVAERCRNVHPKKSMSYTVENISKSSVSSSENAVLQVTESASQLVSPTLSNSSYTSEPTPLIVSPHFNSHTMASVPSSEVSPLLENCTPHILKAGSNVTVPLQMNSTTYSSEFISSAAVVCNTQAIAHRTESIADGMTETAAAVKSVHTEQSFDTSQPTVQLSVRTIDSAISVNQSSKPNAFLKKAEVLKFKPFTSDDKVTLPQQSNSFTETATVPPLSFKGKKLRRKKSMKRLRKLPPLWSVSIMPGTGVRLKFSCSHPEAIESEDGESDFSD